MSDLVDSTVTMVEAIVKIAKGDLEIEEVSKFPMNSNDLIMVPTDSPHKIGLLTGSLTQYSSSESD